MSELVDAPGRKYLTAAERTCRLGSPGERVLIASHIAAPRRHLVAAPHHRVGFRTSLTACSSQSDRPDGT